MANSEKPYVLFKVNQYQRFELHPTKSLTSLLRPHLFVELCEHRHITKSRCFQNSLCVSLQKTLAVPLWEVLGQNQEYFSSCFTCISALEHGILSSECPLAYCAPEVCKLILSLQIFYSYRSLDILLFHNNIWPAIHALSPPVLQDQELASTDVLQVVQTFLVWSETYLAMANLWDRPLHDQSWNSWRRWQRQEKPSQYQGIYGAPPDKVVTNRTG